MKEKVCCVGAGAVVVSGETMRNAVSIGRWTLSNARYCLEGLSLPQRQAKYILARVQQKHARTCTKHDILNWCRNRSLSLEKSMDFKDALELLESDGLVKCAKTETGGLLYDFTEQEVSD